MQIIHGTWIPYAPNQFKQHGAFHIWVETSERVQHTRRVAFTKPHPRHLSWQDLVAFLDEKLRIRAGYGIDLTRNFHIAEFLLPTGDGAPLPSSELLPYTEVELPESWELTPWQLCTYPIYPVIPTLNDIHFAAISEAEEYQLGADLLFWYQYSQVLRGIIVADGYIPSLRYRALEQGAFELHAGWEPLSSAYEEAIRLYAPCMPQVCLASAGEERTTPTLYTPQALLRHFSEERLDGAVTGTSSTAAFDRQLDGSLLAACFRPLDAIPGTDALLEQYKHWAAWRSELTLGQMSGAFTLSFWLQEPASETPEEWEVSFVAVSRRDLSFKVSLSEYWNMPVAQRKHLTSLLGTDFEKQVLLALGYAARIYPEIWKGMETDRPAGFALTLDGAYSFLKEYAWVLEDAGYSVVVPAWWTSKGRRRAKMRVRTSTRSTGSSSPRSHFSLDTLIRYQYRLSIDGKPLSPEEWEQLVQAKTPLVQFRGQWMELDPKELQHMLATWEDRQQAEPEMTLLDLMKVASESNGDLEWEHEPELEEILASLQNKGALEPAGDPENFHGSLREYQKQGVAWLRYLERLGLNPCLADDMGLGKTVQVIAQLVAERNELESPLPTLLIAPTSVLGNWRKEVERFAPHLRALIHSGAGRSKDLAALKSACAEHDLIITSFALARLDEKLLRGLTWQRVVVDEAQNIKNPQSAQTRAITKLSAQHRLALTGTPVENRLRDLWSIFNFLNPGYLGKESQFRRAFEIPIQRDNDTTRSAALKTLVDPFILRRVKTDRSIITDLPEKVEQKVYCNLTPEQASLYQAVVEDTERQLEEAEGIQRRGLILATLTKLKQVCNHPSQFLQDGSPFTSERSHKLQRLAEMVEEVMAERESLLVFTQFTEIGGALERYMSRTMYLPTFYLHGGTSAPRRERMVAEFQDPDSEPSVFILSVRAGGTGLTLTRANHVFHFDRWWNPAVEDQATDRVFRIGQRKNVFAHKFVALGTVEEKIDAMIEDKKRLAGIIASADESWITEMDNASFRDLIALRRSALVE